MEKAKASRAAWQEELEALLKDLPALESAEAAAQAQADEARRAAHAERQTEVAAEIAQSGSLFSDDFEDSKAAERWQRAVGGGFHIVDDPKGQRGKVLAMSSCTWGGDAFSMEGFSCRPESRCTISFWARGAAWQGFSRSTKRTEEPRADAHSWLAVPAANPDFSDRLLSTKPSDDWGFYEYEFPEQDAFQMLGAADVAFSSGKVHIMLQAHDSTGHCDSTMFDSFRVRKDNAVAFLDADGDKVEFKMNEAGQIDAYANNQLMVTDVPDLRTDDMFIHFGEYRAKAPSKDIVRRAEEFFQRRHAAPQPADAPAVDAEAPAPDPAEAAVGGTPAEAPKTPEVSEYAKWALDQDASGAEAAPPPSQDSSSTAGNKGASWSRVASNTAAGRDSEADRALQEAESVLEEAKSKLQGKRSRREDLELKLKQVDEDPRLLTLSSTCVEKRIQPYLYKICFFEQASQDHVELGTFERWEPGSNSVLLFTNGQHCHGGPARSLRVQLVCGPKASLNDVSEPSRCSYAAEVVHPSVCREEDLRALEDPANHRLLRPHEEL